MKLEKLGSVYRQTSDERKAGLIPSEALPQTDEACRVTPTIAEDYLRSSTHTNVTVKYSLAWQAVFLGYV